MPKRVVATFVTLALAASVLVVAAPQAHAEEWMPPDSQQFDFVEIQRPSKVAEKPGRVEQAKLERAVWPTGGEAEVTGVVRSRDAKRAGSLPVTIAAPAKAERPIDSARVRVLDQASSQALVEGGVVVALSGAPGAQAEVGLDYSSFGNGAGGGYGSRLRWAQLPVCALERPDDPECQVLTPLESTNDTGQQILLAEITLPEPERAENRDPATFPAPPGPDLTTSPSPPAGTPEAPEPTPSAEAPTGKAVPPQPAEEADPVASGEPPDGSQPAPLEASVPEEPRQEPAPSQAMVVLAAMAGVSSDQGNYGLTSLKPSSTWQAGGSSGTFSWSYPLRTPPVAGGLAPELAISYDSGSTDGAVSSTNNQASWVGEGFDLSMGFIERTYVPCVADKPDRGTAPATAADLCWWSDSQKTNDAAWDNAMLTLGAHSGVLVRVGNTAEWRLKDDDGTRVTKYGTPAGSGGATTEYWVVTTPDGTQYYFGKGEAEGSSTATKSRWMVPVGANHAQEPGYHTSFASAIHAQAWRWNLDYVVDPSGDTMTVYYANEVNQYKKLGATTVSYDRGGTIAAIHYGERKGSESATPAAKVTFVTKERCNTSLASNCETASPTPATVVAWPDVPTDAICEAGGYCPDIKNAPTFFSRKRLAEVHTWSLNTAGSSYDQVDSWALGATFPNTNDATSTPTLWLSTITHTGKGATANITLPKVTLEPAMMRNRIQGSSGTYGLNRPRLYRIFDEHGARVTISYSGEDCTPTTLPSDPANNTKRCFPVYYAANPTDTPTVHWFAKYVVNTVTAYDTSSATVGLPAVTGLDLSTEQIVNYSYGLGGAWHWDDSPLTPDNQRTWNQWRGYGKTTTASGKSGSTRTVTEDTWFRGMHGDRLDAAGTATRNEVVNDTGGGSSVDFDPLAGQRRETRILKAVDGAPHSRDIYQVASQQTATDGRDAATMVTVDQAGTTEYLSPGSRSATTTVVSRDEWGQPTAIEETGDEAVTGDERCTRTVYAAPEAAATAIDRIAEQSVMPSLCSVAANDSQVLSRVRHYYDGATDTGKVTGPGFITRTEELAGSTTRDWRTVVTTGYDDHGRVTTSTDALGRTTSISYNPATGRAPRTVTVTSPSPDDSGSKPPLVTTTTYDHRWGIPTRLVSPAGQTTDIALDALGRTTAVWLPGRSRASQSASLKYTYVVNQSGTGVNALRTETLLPDGTGYRSQWSILDALLRPRQTQTASGFTGTQVTDTRYDSRGNPALADQYLVAAAPASTLVVPVTRGDIKRSDRVTYDYAGRPLVEAFYSAEAHQWQTSTVYEGEKVKVTPAAGGTPTTTVFDIHGRTTALSEHLGTTPAATASTTSYGYDAAGRLATMVDPKGNTWRYTYDMAGNKLTAADPDAGLTTMTYDDGDRLITTTDARGQGVRNVYDNLDRITATKTLDNTATLTSSVYDTLKPGLLTSTTRHVEGAQLINRVNSYDVAGRPTSSSLVVPAITGLIPAGLAGTYTVTTGYKPDGQIATMGLPATGPINAETLTYGYTTTGLPTSLTGMASLVKTTAYTQWDTIASMTMGAATGNGIMVMQDRQESTLRLTRIRTIRQVAGATVDEDTNYTYDASGNIVQAKATLGSGAVDNQCFQYDYQGQLKQAFTAAPAVACTSATAPSQSSLGTGPSPYWTTWTTDTIGKTSQRVDRTATTSATTAYTYPANGGSAVRPHAVTQTVTTGSTTATRGYGYDAAGNTTTRPGPTGVVQTLSYDGEGRLSRVTAGGSTISRLVYDAVGTRVIRNENGKTTLTVAGTELTIDNTTAVKTASRYYGHAGHIVAVRTGNTNATLYSVISDHQGTTHHQIRNSDSQLRTTWQDPYGGRRGTAPAGWAGERGFVGGLQDATGLLRIGVRDYDTVLQRFITVDPIQDLADPLQWNPYLYASNTPITKADPTGAFPRMSCIDSCDWDQRHLTSEFIAREHLTITGKWPTWATKDQKTSGPMPLTPENTKGKNPYESSKSSKPKADKKPGKPATTGKNISTATQLTTLAIDTASLAGQYPKYTPQRTSAGDLMRFSRSARAGIHAWRGLGVVGIAVGAVGTYYDRLSQYEQAGRDDAQAQALAGSAIITVASVLGGVAGSILGSMIGGPVGGYLGGVIGSAVGGAVADGIYYWLADRPNLEGRP